MRICPYCKTEAGAIGGGDDYIDYCAECELVIEGHTIEVDEDELNHLAEQQRQEWQAIDIDEDWIAQWN
jgi:Zn-finger nucleic acid-binding protein